MYLKSGKKLFEMSRCRAYTNTSKQTQSNSHNVDVIPVSTITQNVTVLFPIKAFVSTSSTTTISSAPEHSRGFPFSPSRAIFQVGSMPNKVVFVWHASVDDGWISVKHFNVC